ncbi:M16 family metallopeptidase [Rhizomicrobium electricum]|uniref:Pitrilysin family protein n=1 Tax=Rhizomicrobium electricum TaxID=480070 RepID=A0ABP3PJL8_9PROT|nr:pitrilysin family protein [Rhizomicrobium electricum]NIJ47072.1 zinc protease [Rhizomicrobium electricum]
MIGRLAALLLALVMLVPASAAKVKPVDVLPGVVVWHSEDHTIPVIALSATFPAGAIYDPSGKSGMAALAAYCLNEGAGRMNAEEFQTELAAHGIKLEILPSRDTLTIRLTTLSSNAKEAFRLLGLALSKPRFDPDAVTRVRLQMMQELDLGREDPSTVAERGFYSLYFGPYTYGRPADGDTRGLASISAQDLRAFAKTHWVRGDLKIAVAGDVTPAVLSGLIQSAFGTLADTTPTLPPWPYRPGAPGLHILPMDVPQPAVVFGQPGPLRQDRDYIAAMIANYILGGAGSGSRLTRELRENRGLTYDVVTDLVPYRRAGLLMGAVSTRKSAVRQTIAAVRETMRKFAADGPTQQELNDAKLYLNGSFPLSFTSNADIAAQLNAFQVLGLPLDYLDRRAALINAVSLADVRRVAHSLFDPGRLTIVVAGSLTSGNTEPADSQ